MASILRSSKFVRYIAGFARNIVVNTPREFDGSIVNSTQCFCGAIPRSLATQVGAQHEQNLDSCLKRLDQDVRRTGRISRRDIEDVLEEIRHARSPTSSQSLLVIRCCGNLVPEELPETRTKLVQEIWNSLMKLNVPMDISHYNALLRVYLENEHEFVPTDILAELETKGIEPNRVTYQRLIAKYCQNGDIEGATRILEYMREKQLPVNENVFNALINGHSMTGDMTSAHGILAVMLQAGLDPSADTYTTLICGYAKQGDVEMIKMLLDECDKKEIFLLDKDYLEIMYSLAVNGHEAFVTELLTKVKKQFGYNQDAINVIFRLINKSCDDTAYTIMKSMVRNERIDGNHQSMGTFFLKHLVKADRPVEMILDICQRMEDDQLFSKPISYITERALEMGNEKIAFDLLHRMKEQGLPIRNHYFWPLILSKAKDETGNGIINVLIEMGKFNVHPNSETIREYVLPNLKGKSSDIISKLRLANISIGSAACSLAVSLIQRFDLAEAAVIMQTVQAFYHPELIRRPLTTAFYKTNDVDNYISILRQVYENFDKKADFEGDTNVSVDKTQVVGRFITDLAAHGRQFNDVAVPVLEALVAQGLTISTSVAEKIEERIGEKMTPEISAMLARLSSGELIPLPIERKAPAYVPSSQMNIQQLEILIKNLDAKKQDTKGMKRQLLGLYYRNKELEKMEALYKELESNPDFKYTTGVYAQLLDTCAYHEKYDETMKYLKLLLECDPNCRLDDSKMIRVATVMVKNNKMDEAVEFLKRPREIKEEKNYMFNSLCWRLLNHLAEAGKVDEVQLMFDTLMQQGYLEINNIILGPLVKVHIVNNDINKALERFEWCCSQFRSTPWKNELACQLIQAEDAERLQKLTDLSTSVHGEINSLYDLVFAFVECGRVRQARKILETPGFQSRPQRINVACQRYREEGLIEPLEGLREATKDLNHIDRSDIYYQLLLSYTKQNDVSKAEALWTQMQEEDLPPTDHFLIKLGTLMKNNNITPPFTIPQTEIVVPQNTKAVKTRNIQLQIATPLPTKKDVTIFRNAVKAGDIDKALGLQRTSKEQFTSTDISLLIEKLVQQNRSEEATKLTLDALANGLVPLTRVFRFLLNKLANAGDVTSIELIGSKLDSEMKKVVSFDNRICHANLMAGKAEEYLNMLEKELDGAKEQDLEVIGEKFPRGGAVGILERHPELLEKYEQLAVKYAKRGIIAPINVLWSHYFINNQSQKADAVWKDYLEGAPRIMFQRVVQHAREVNDDVLTEKLIAHLKTSKVTDGALGNAYSCYLDVLVTKEKHEEAVRVFDTALKAVPIDYINRTAVLRVKESFEKLGKPFNYTIPAKHKTTTQQSSSSSSETSDEDSNKPIQGQPNISSKN